ncbi:MAG: rhodanese-like domain-containing protein [Deltaproteobacteria bacterium]
MTNIMKDMKKLLLEMTVIIFVASLIGIILNHKMLLKVCSGRFDLSKITSPGVQRMEKIPMPVGLLQAKELFERKEAVFVDARDASFFSRGHLKGAVLMPLGESELNLARFMVKVPSSATLVIYCNGYDCRDSMTLGAKLMEKGYRKVYVYEGGYPEWRDAGLPIEREAP